MRCPHREADRGSDNKCGFVAIRVMNLSTFLLVTILQHIDGKENHRDTNDDGRDPDEGIQRSMAAQQPSQQQHGSKQPGIVQRELHGRQSTRSRNWKLAIDQTNHCQRHPAEEIKMRMNGNEYMVT